MATAVHYPITVLTPSPATRSIPVIVPADPPGLDELDEPRGRVHAEPRPSSDHLTAADFAALWAGEGIPAHRAPRRPRRPILARLRYALSWKG